MYRVTQRIGSGVGVSQWLEPSAAQVELLRGHCGIARAAYNTLQYQARANLGQRTAQKSSGITGSPTTSPART
jgi:hypothetical protein